MSRKGYCKLCRFFENYPSLRSDFEEKVEEGYSLRKLSKFLEDEGFQCRKDGISKHLREKHNRRTFFKAVRRTVGSLFIKLGRWIRGRL